MRLGFQIVLVIFVGFSAIYAGIINFYDPAIILASAFDLDISQLGRETQLAIASQVRVLAGMWIIAGVFIVLSARRFELHTNTIRLVILGSSLGIIGELITVIALDGDLKAGLIKCSFAVSVYFGIEYWRYFLVKKYMASNSPGVDEK